MGGTTPKSLGVIRIHGPHNSDILESHSYYKREFNYREIFVEFLLTSGLSRGIIILRS